MLNNLVLGDDMLSLSFDGGTAARFDYFWLRDNARDPESYDSRSHQRELFTAAESAFREIAAGGKGFASLNG